MTTAGQRYDLDALEFQVVRDLLAEKMLTPIGRGAALALAPLASVEQANEALQAARELATRLASGSQPPMAGVVDVRAWIDAFFTGERLPLTKDLADLKRV